MTQSGSVVGVASDGEHRFSKVARASIRLVEGLGVEGDAHFGRTVQHLSRVRRDPTQPNLRQVHLIQAELFDELRGRGFAVGPADMGENVATRGIALLDLPRGARLRLGAEALVEITGLRNPCLQIDRFRDGLMAATLGRTAGGGLIRKAGVMAVVVRGGEVHPGDAVAVELPAGVHEPLQPV